MVSGGFDTSYSTSFVLGPISLSRLLACRRHQQGCEQGSMHADRKCDGKLHFTLVFQTLCFQRGGGEKAQTQQRDGQKEEGKNAKTTETFFLVACSAQLYCLLRLTRTSLVLKPFTLLLFLFFQPSGQDLAASRSHRRDK